MAGKPRTSPRTVKAGPAVFDVDALAKEAKGEPFRFKLGGTVFKLPPSNELDWQDAQDLEQGNLTSAFRGMLGDKQYEKFVAHRLDIARLQKLVTAYMAHQGLEPGESEASPSS